MRTGLLGWAGLRGAVPIVLATFVLSSEVPHKETIFNAVFFVVVVSTIVQGSTLEWVAGSAMQQLDDFFIWYNDYSVNTSLSSS